jgi:hypothetical protein
MRLFRFRRPPVPAIVEETRKLDPGESVRDLAKAVNAAREATSLDGAAQGVVSSLARSRIRNGFAPVIESSIINRRLGGA